MRYVLVFPRKMDARGRLRAKSTVMLIRKAKPLWQRGRFNLVGGKVEEGETSLDAAIREFKEETGITGEQFEFAGVVDGNDWSIAVFDCVVPQYANPIFDPVEQAAWYNWHDVKDDPALIENLRLMVPMLMTRTYGWLLNYEVDSSLPTVGQVCLS